MPKTIICPHCDCELEESEIKAIWASFCSNHLTGRTSEKKRLQSALNGKRGGRPIKTKAQNETSGI